MNSFVGMFNTNIRRMKLLLILLIMFCSTAYGQNELKKFEPSKKHTFGLANPDAPEAITDFESLIGVCNCKSLQRGSDGNWQDTLSMEWKFKYIMNGTAVQDEVWRDGGVYAGSIRQYQQDSAQWVVTYFSYPSVSATPGVWMGGKDNENNLVFLRPQKAPNGMDGISRLTFSDITESGFNWNGEWVSVDGSFTYPFWMIWCKKLE